MTYDAAASATPTPTTVGSALGDTWSAECSIPAAGQAQLTVFLKTSDGSFKADDAVVQNDNGTHTTNSVSADYPAGTLASPTTLDTPVADAAPNHADHNIEIVQLAPSPGHIVLHGNAKTTTSPAAQTCHLSIESFPETLSDQ
jgi:hypothetical protein